MAKQLTDERLKAIAAEYMTNGQQKVKALLSVGYSKNYSEHCGLKIFDNDRFKQILAQLQAKIDIKTDFTVEFVRQEMVNLLNAAKTKDDLTNVKGAVELMARHKSMLTDNVKTDNTTRQELNPLQQQELETLAKEVKIKLVQTKIA
jgi:hypothetical protein